MQKHACRARPFQLNQANTKWLLALLFGCLLTAIPARVMAGDAQSPALGSAAPQKITCRSKEEAFQLGNTYAVSLDGRLVMTSGTRSMEPLIRGKAYVVVKKLPYETITQGALLVYLGRPSASKPDRISMLHRTVAHDSGGWLMRGDNNARTESWDRVTPTNYLGTVEIILEFPQA